MAELRCKEINNQTKLKDINSKSQEKKCKQPVIFERCFVEMFGHKNINEKLCFTHPMATDKALSFCPVGVMTRSSRSCTTLLLRCELVHTL